MFGDEIVITGIAGKFPNSENVEMFQKKLLNMENLLSSKNPEWITGSFTFPEKNGQITDVRFDAQSFGIHKKFAENMDPVMRLQLQTAYEAVGDAGINPRTLRGKKVAVFTGTNTGETELTVDYNPNESTLLGNAKAMFANRISFFLGLEGPSTTINCSGTSSAVALEKGYAAIKSGEVESAIVGGGNVILHPHLSLQLLNLGLLSPDGLTRSFDESANGFTRSEAIVVFFLQKARDAKRIYAEIKNVHSWTGPMYERLSVLYPTSDSQTQLMKMSLKECGLSGKDISFVEADGLGIKEADAEEIKAIDQVYNNGRKTPLLVGSVKSNVGSSDTVNTLISIIKVITMFESGNIPPNLHYNKPSEEMTAIHEGRIQIVTEPTSWNGEYAAVNTTSIGGAFATVILKSFKKPEESKKHPTDDLPRLTMISGVTEDAVNTILDYMESKPVDSEMFQMINDVFEVENVSHLYRGYTLLPPCGTLTSKYREVEFVSGFKREIWYVFSGMGSQWIGMGKALMNLPVFAESVRKCDAVLKPHKVDIIKILTAEDPKMFDNVVNSFVGITTIQVGLVDLLNYLGIQPDYMIGHSLGEIGCAYADGCLTAEQAVLNALFRGFASVETKLEKGSMAAVGLGYEEIKHLCPPDIDVACHNSAESSTISGPVDSMKIFISSLKAKGIFAKEVPSCNIAYHSRYIEPAGSKLLEYLRKIIPNSKLRGEKWLSTSVPSSEWGTPKARLSSAEYYTNNLLNPVLFEEVSKKIPSNAITLEIAPHGLLQAILKRALPSTVANISMTKRGHQNNVEVVMDAIGKLYINSGCRANITKLYPKISYPVSSGTPSISSLFRWNTSEIWDKFGKKMWRLGHDAAERKYTIDFNDEAWQFLTSNKIFNKIILPFSFYLKLALSAMETFDQSEKPIMFENVVIYKNQCINEDDVLELIVMVQRGSGSFEVTMDGALLCSGTLQRINSFNDEETVIDNLRDKLNEELENSEFYNELLLRGYQYSKPFKTICKINPKQSYGYVLYQEEWNIFLEGMMQMYMFEYNRKTTQVPLKFRKIILDLNNYRSHSKLLKAIPVSVNHQFNSIRSCGIKVDGIQLSSFQQESNINSLNIEKMKLTLNFDEALTSPAEFVRVVLQLLIENDANGKIIQLIEENVDILAKTQKCWQTIFDECSEMQSRFKIVSSSPLERNEYKDTALRVFYNMTTLTNTNLLYSLKEGDFLLAILNAVDENEVLSTMKMFDLGIILHKQSFTNQVALLFRKKRMLLNSCIIEIADEAFALTAQIKEKINSANVDRIILSTKFKHAADKTEIFNLLSEEHIKRKVRYFEILDSKAPQLSIKEPLYQNQLQLDLKFNILTAERKWGFINHVPIVTERCRVDEAVAIQSRPGDLDSFDWIEASYENDQDEELVKVEYSTINEFDVLYASGETNTTSNRKSCKSKKIQRDMETFGFEYAGTNANGHPIMGISGSGTLCSFTSPDSELTWDIPKGWTLKEAATVPLAYSAAYMALYLKGEIKKKSSVFIYDDSCALGQATITLSLNEELQVFSTYRTEEEKELLKLQYPSLNEDHLCCSKDSFEDKILSLTKGAGVDLIIYNSSNLNRLESCLSIMKKCGRAVVVGEFQETFNKSVGMLIFLREISLYSIIPHNLVNVDVDTKKKLSSMVKDGLRRSIIKPLFLKAYSRDELKKAFIDVGRNTCYEKVMIKVQPMDSKIGRLVVPCFSCFENRTYLLLIDNWNNLFGIKIIEFLIEHGAKNVLVVSTTRHISKSLYYYHSKNWEENEVKVVLEDNLDLAGDHNMKSLLSKAFKLNPIDAIFDLQRMGTSQNSLCSKYLITKNLCKETKTVCPDLRHFVICTTLKDADDDFNSHLFRESELTKLCDERTNEGLPIRLILWGPLQEIVELKSLASKKCNLLLIHECMQELDRLIALPTSNIIVSKNFTDTSHTKNTNKVREINEKQVFEDYIFNRV